MHTPAICLSFHLEFYKILDSFAFIHCPFTRKTPPPTSSNQRWWRRRQWLGRIFRWFSLFRINCASKADGTWNGTMKIFSDSPVWRGARRTYAYCRKMDRQKKPDARRNVEDVKGKWENQRTRTSEQEWKIKINGKIAFSCVKEDFFLLQILLVYCFILCVSLVGWHKWHATSYRSARTQPQ